MNFDKRYGYTFCLLNNAKSNELEIIHIEKEP